MSDDVIDFNKRKAQRGEAMFEFAPFTFQGGDTECPSVGLIDGDQPVVLMTDPPLVGIAMTREDALALGRELVACAEAKEGLPERPKEGDMFLLGGEAMRVKDVAFSCSCGSASPFLHVGDCPAIEPDAPTPSGDGK